jgi:hypothetical protein
LTTGTFVATFLLAMQRLLLRRAVFLAPIGAAVLAMSACARNQVSAAASKPLSPAEGTADYKYSPGGPHERPTVPSPTGKEPTTGEVSDCPPRCNADGSWSGCGLKKSRGSDCQGCTPTCKAKDTPDEGWYDCSGMLIVPRKCGS